MGMPVSLGLGGWLVLCALAGGGAVTDLFGENQFAVPGNAQAIVLTSMTNQDFLIALE